jgi:hypothetical protein
VVARRYARHKGTAEPVFGRLKENRGVLQALGNLRRLIVAGGNAVAGGT